MFHVRKLWKSSITPKVLGKQLGNADEISHISNTNEINYIYKDKKL